MCVWGGVLVLFTYLRKISCEIHFSRGVKYFMKRADHIYNYGLQVGFMELG